MLTRSPSDAHGLVRPWEQGRSFELDSRPPSVALERLVGRFWIVRWDLEDGTFFEQEILPHPSLNLVVEPDRTRVWGVPTQRDRRQLHGRGRAVGTKFKPGAFTALTGIEAASVTDDSIGVRDAFGTAPELGDVDLANDDLCGGRGMAAADGRHRRPVADADRPDHCQHAGAAAGCPRAGDRRGQPPRTADAAAPLPPLCRRQPQVGAQAPAHPRG
jgi:hypothetical protein